MAWCKDPFISQLNAMGFNALRVPRLDYEPCKLLIRGGATAPTLFGSFADGFHGVNPPEFVIGASGQLAHAASGKYRRTLGLKLISDWLTSPIATFASAFSGAKSVSFRFEYLRLLSVPLAQLSQAIFEAEPTNALVDAASARLFVIGEVLQTKELVVVVEGCSANSLDAVAPALQESAAALEVSIDQSHTNAGVLVFRSSKQHSIGFKAYELEIANGGFRLTSSNAAAGLSHLSEGDQQFVPVLFDEHKQF